MLLTSTELARQLSVSKGRVSQYVAEGKLSGCYSGEGRNRRFDLAKCAAALGRSLDPGQMMGNGASTRKAISEVKAKVLPTVSDVLSPVGQPPLVPMPQRSFGATELPPSDPDRYELARTQKAEEEARRLRRQNAQEEGQYVLASEVERQVARLLSQELAEVDTVLRAAARNLADNLGVDFKRVRQILTEAWRSHRGTRADVLQRDGEASEMSDAEREADI